VGARPLGAVGEADPLTASAPGFGIRRIVGILVSVLFPGLGHVVVGRTRRGVAWLVLEAAVLPATLLGLVLLEASGIAARPGLMLGLLLVAFLFALSLHVAAPLDLARLPVIQPPRLRTTVVTLAVAVVATTALGFTDDAIGRAALRSRYVQGSVLRANSMAPAVLSGDHLVANRFVYRLREPVRGDVVIFKYPLDEERDFLKRVIGLPGEDLYIEDRRIYLNCRPPEPGCQPIRDPWGYHGDRAAVGRGKLGPLRVPPGSYFVMGDNRDNSQDSREWGFVEKEHLVGKALFVYWSWRPDPDAPKWESPYVIPFIQFLVYYLTGWPTHIRWDRIGSALN